MKHLFWFVAMLFFSTINNILTWFLFLHRILCFSFLLGHLVECMLNDPIEIETSVRKRCISCDQAVPLLRSSTCLCYACKNCAFGNITS